MQLLGTGYQRAGKASKITVTGQILAYSSYEANVEGQDLDTTNFESYDATVDQSYEEGILGVLRCGLTYGGDWDAGLNPLDEPPGLYPRDDLDTLALFTNVNDATYWYFPYSRIRTAVNGSAVRDKVTFRVTGANQGTFTFPTGSQS